MNLKTIYTTTSSEMQEVFPSKNGYPYAAKYLTLAVSQDTNIYLNNSDEPVFVRSRYGLTLPENMFTIDSIKIESAYTEVYCVFAY